MLKSISLSFLALALVACGSSEPGLSSSEAPPPVQKAAIENALVPLVTFEGEEGGYKTLRQRREELGVPYVSVAVFKDGELHWYGGYGGAALDLTRFQAASLSKPVAAAGILTFARNNGYGLDDDISGDLTGLDLSQLNPDGAPITLRGLLSHTNGLTVSGFPGYRPDLPLPTQAQIIMGEEPANTDPVVLRSDWVGERHYSGGGYQLAQYWVETVSGERFADLMDRLVLAPLNMNDSTFEVILPSEADEVGWARAYDGADNPVAGEWHLYPESAAAGLWTTPQDYRKFAMALIAGVNGEDQVIHPDVAAEMTTAIADDYGLGIGVEPKGDNGEIRLTHGGSNRGFLCYVMAFPERGDAIITMTNSGTAWPLIWDINRTANIEYGWPSSPPIVKTRAEVAEGELSQYTGVYVRQEDEIPSPLFTLSAEGNDLKGEVINGYKFTLVKIGEGVFIDPADAEEARFRAAEDGARLMVSGDTTYIRLSPAEKTSE